MYTFVERRNGGEMGSLIRSFDWASTPLGSASQWPQSLKTAVGLMLNSSHPMFIWWGQELIQFYNDAYRKTLGHERHPSALGQPGRECWREIWPIIGSQIDSVLAGGPSTWHEDQLVALTRHGRREDVWWTYGYSAIPGEGGCAGVLVVCTDVTEAHLQKTELIRVNEQLRSQSKRMERMFEQAPGFMCLLRGPEHVFEFANRAYRSLLGNRELIGRNLLDAVPEAAGQPYPGQLDRTYKTGRPFIATAQAVQVRPDPDSPLTLHYLDFIYQPIVEHDGSVSGIFVQGSDTTEHVRAQQSLADADRRKDEFLAILAHELRNPIAALSTSALLLQMPGLDPEKLRKIGDLCQRQVGHMSDLVEDLLDTSRVSQGLATISKSLCTIDDIINDAVEQVQSLIEARNHRLVIQNTGVATIYADRKRVIQVVANLLNNAAKYTPPNGHLTLAVAATPDEVVIDVTDDGHGIESAMLPRVFDKFTQASRSGDRSQGGLGIGLSLVKGIIELHGGTVRATSEGLGKGSKFVVTLPRAHQSVAAATQSADDGPATGRSRRSTPDNDDAAATLQND